MIDFDFGYVRAKDVNGAIEVFKKGKSPFYLAGGTEYISRARMNEIQTDVIIDVKDIKEAQVYEKRDGMVIIGAAIPLNVVIDQPLFPLLAEVARGIATRTARNKITLGGNLCSHLPYKEAILPFLLADSNILVGTANGLEKRSIHELYQMKKDEILLQVLTKESAVESVYTYGKKTKQSSVNYPIVTLCTMELDKELRIACSGLTHTPFRAFELENNLSKEDIKAFKLEKWQEYLPNDAVLDDFLASRAYRAFVLVTMLEQIKNEGMIKP